MIIRRCFVLCYLGSSLQNKLLIIEPHHSLSNQSDVMKFGNLWITTANCTVNCKALKEVEDERFFVFQHSVKILQRSPPNWVSFLLNHQGLDRIDQRFRPLNRK